MQSGKDEFVSFMEGLSLKMCKLSKIRRLTKSGAESKIENPLLETGVLHASSQWALILEWDGLAKILLVRKLLPLCSATRM